MADHAAPTSQIRRKRRLVPWDISREDYALLRQEPCFYCDGPLPPHGKGLDRLDESRGYEIDNVVPCCRFCNGMRHGLGLSILQFRRVIAIYRQRHGTFKWPGYEPDGKHWMHISTPVMLTLLRITMDCGVCEHSHTRHRRGACVGCVCTGYIARFDVRPLGHASAV